MKSYRHHVAAIRPNISGQGHKHGVWASDKIRVVTWNLDPGQRIVAHAHPYSDEALVVIAGTGIFLVYDHDNPPVHTVYIPDPEAYVPPPAAMKSDELATKIPLQAGSVVAVQPGLFSAVINTGEVQMILTAMTSPPSGSSMYVAR